LTQTATSNRWQHLAFLIIAALVVLTDQISKYVVTRTMTPYQEWAPIPAIQRLFAITYVTNTGAAFGIFPQASTVFAVVAVVVVIALFFYNRQLESGQWLLRLSLGLQLGGAVGNLIDRLTRGFVVDFIHFKLWPVWNVADASIVVGVALMAFFLLREGQVEPEKTQDTEVDSSEENLSAAS